ncbi:MAG: alpha-2-macroglobulin family protein, partial [Flavobacteriales bacterium]|nr:alpha-2-macroglobulin family protein [Flavobacteriales bacterium]
LAVADMAESEDSGVDEVQVLYKDGLAGVPKSKNAESTVSTPPPKNIKMRSDFSETVFFHPHLVTDDEGKVEMKFNAPQSLTRWKFMGLATTEELQIGTVTKEVVTRKQLMVTPNYPRFVREGDKLIFQVKINALDSSVSNVSASLEFKDGLTGKDLQLTMDDLHLEIENSSTVASWEIDIPEGISAIKLTTKAWSEKHSDGEEKTIPVLSNRMLVTESMPLPVRGKGTHTFTFDKLKNSNSSTLRNHALTLEFTPNPIWLAVLSLPYMMEYPYECSEQIFSRYYSNAIGSYLANSDPAIKRVFDQWKRDAQDNEGDAFLSELEKNPELKQALLTETPWIRDAQNETEQRRRIAELFDIDRMDSELRIALKKLKQNQQADGGWGWFNGLRSDMYITRYIVSGFGKMRKMGVWKIDDETGRMLDNAIEFLDEEMVKYYDRRALKKEDYVPTWTDLHMTYARSFWMDDFKLTGKAKTTYNAILKTIREKWTNLDASQKGLAAVVLNRSGSEADAKKVIVSLRETALTSKEFGAYWAMDKGYYWYQAPIENHVMILEAFDEVAQDDDMVSEMNIWLLKQKQTQSWETTKATAEACYALLSTGNTDFETEPLVSIQLGQETIVPRKDPDLKTEAGTGYFKTNWTKNSVSAEMGNVSVTKDNEGVVWGAVYWQYFEDLDKISGAEDNPIKMTREVMLMEDTENGPVMKLLDENTSLSVGNRVKVRLVLKTDRHMEYVHLKDMRAASFEPREQLSGARSQEGLYYYQSPTDAAMNFFFGYLPKGTFVFEYDLNVTQAGQFSNGISQLQCMYAPEFTTHSEGIRLDIEH